MKQIFIISCLLKRKGFTIMSPASTSYLDWHSLFSQVLDVIVLFPIYVNISLILLQPIGDHAWMTLHKFGIFWHPYSRCTSEVVVLLMPVTTVSRTNLLLQTLPLGLLLIQTKLSFELNFHTIWPLIFPPFDKPVSKIVFSSSLFQTKQFWGWCVHSKFVQDTRSLLTIYIAAKE